MLSVQLKCWHLWAHGLTLATWKWVRSELTQDTRWSQHITLWPVLRWWVRCFSEWLGKPIDFVGVDDSTARWVQDFNVKPYATPAKLESIDGENIHFLSHSGSFHSCSCCFWLHFAQIRHDNLFQVPDTRRCSSQTVLERWMTWHTVALCTAFSHTSFLNKVSLRRILKQSVSNLHVRPGDLDAGCVFSLCAEPVCAVGQGVSALCCATEGQRWIFSGYSLTGVSLPQVNMRTIYLNIFMHSI